MKKTIKILSIALAAGMISMLSVKAEEPAAADYAASETFSEVVMEQELCHKFSREVTRYKKALLF